MAAKIYPDWVQQYRRRGTTIKKVGENYYLYKHSSKRVAGRKNPVPVDTYIGRITPQGVEEKGVRKVNTVSEEVIVKEYGFSRTVELLCPIGWKEIQGKDWQNVLDFIICSQSPESYIRDIRSVPDELDGHIQAGAVTASLSRRIRRIYGKELDDLKILSTIYLVSIGKSRMVSKISEKQKELLDKLGIRLEV